MASKRLKQTTIVLKQTPTGDVAWGRIEADSLAALQCTLRGTIEAERDRRTGCGSPQPTVPPALAAALMVGAAAGAMPAQVRARPASVSIAAPPPSRLLLPLQALPLSEAPSPPASSAAIGGSTLSKMPRMVCPTGVARLERCACRGRCNLRQ